MKSKLLILFLSIAFSCNAQWFALNQNFGGAGTCQFDLSTASYDNVAFDFSTQDGVPISIEFKPDGLIMYMVGFSTDSVFQYTLSSAFDVTTASYANIAFFLRPQDATPRAVRFKPDGTKMYYLGSATDDAYQYTLSTPWNVSTATYDSKSVDLTPEDAFAADFFFKDDGSKMYYAGQTGFNDTIFQYTLSTVWDISTATYDDVVFALSVGSNATSGIYITSSGTQLFSITATNAVIQQYTISTSWDISTASYDDILFNGSSQESVGQSIYFKADCSNFFMSGSSNDSIYQYSY